MRRPLDAAIMQIVLGIGAGALVFSGATLAGINRSWNLMAVAEIVLGFVIVLFGSMVLPTRRRGDG